MPVTVRGLDVRDLVMFDRVSDPRVSVIIVSYRSAEPLRLTIPALLRRWLARFRPGRSGGVGSTSARPD